MQDERLLESETKALRTVAKICSKNLKEPVLLIPEMPMFLKYNIKGSTFLETPVHHDEHEKVHVSASIPDTIEAYGRLFASATRFSTTANLSGKRDVKSFCVFFIHNHYPIPR